MTLEQLKEQIRSHIGNAQPQTAIRLLAEWAIEKGNDQLKNDIAQIKASLTSLDREAMLGILDSTSASTQRAKINVQILELLGTLRDQDETPGGSSAVDYRLIPDLQPIRQAVQTAKYSDAINLLDEFFDRFPNPQYSQLKQTIEHYLLQGLMPPPASLQGLEMLINQLERVGRL